ncbi:MAG: 4'-phosphopantetheinyl transferase superfamily protein [Clostridia bacterium]|nr:4'-phosphopantetheinyl transferase superfamily protein [Clostridia bacterium]
MIWEMRDLSVMTESDYENWLALIEPPKRARIMRMRQIADRRRSVCADRLVRELVARFCGCDVSSVKLDTTDRGKPFVVGKAVEISISHSGERVLCAVSDRPIGADIQQIKLLRPAMIRRVCSEKEQTYVDGDEAKFFEIWCYKEAVFKCRGTGLTRFEEVDFFSENYPRICKNESGYALCIVTEKEAEQ